VNTFVTDQTDILQHGAGESSHRKDHNRMVLSPFQEAHMGPQFLIPFALLTSGLFLAATAPPASAHHPQEATDFASHFNHGGEMMQQMRYHDAVAEFREAVRLNPGYLPGHQALAVGYAITQCFDLSWQEVALLRQAGTQLPDEFMRGLGEEISEKDAAAQREANSKELASAREAAAREPKNAEARARLGNALAKTGDFPAAQKEADMALQLNPKEPKAHLVLATILGGDPPTRQESLPHLKLYLQNVARTPAASPDIARAYLQLADFHGRMNQESQAISAYEDGLKVEPENSVILNNAAWLYATASDTSLRNPQKALAYAQKAVAITKEEKSTFLDTLGESFYANGRFDEAIAAEKKAIALSPDSDLYADQLKKFQKGKQNAAAPKP
jgi:tetratricopeptide (TPR) repeat protein